MCLAEKRQTSPLPGNQAYKYHWVRIHQ
jgi:hypothetical protein